MTAGRAVMRRARAGGPAASLAGGGGELSCGFVLGGAGVFRYLENNVHSSLSGNDCVFRRVQYFFGKPPYFFAERIFGGVFRQRQPLVIGSADL